MSLSFFSLSRIPSYFTIHSHTTYNFVTEYTAKARVKHFNAQFTTINTLKSYSFALWLPKCDNRRDGERKKFVVDIELTIKQ